jgi:hypothetical protein
MSRTHSLEFDRLDSANEARKVAGPWLAESDDRRRTKIEVKTTVPPDVLGLLEWREYRSTPSRRFGQAPLTSAERYHIRLPETDAGGANVFHARSCKAIAEKMEVSDWVAHYDRTLTVDEHFDVYERVRTDVPRSVVPSYMRGKA